MGHKNSLRWFVFDDVNGFLGTVIDTFATTAIMAYALTQIFHFPASIVYKNIIPGMALAICLGNFLFSFLAVYLNKKNNRTDITAFPLGLDTPTTISFAFIVVGPGFLINSVAWGRRGERGNYGLAYWNGSSSGLGTNKSYRDIFWQ